MTGIERHCGHFEALWVSETVTYFGLDAGQIRAFSEQAGSRGVDHNSA